MFVIENLNGERMLNVNTFKCVDKSKVHRTWKKENSVRKVYDSFPESEKSKFKIVDLEGGETVTEEKSVSVSPSLFSVNEKCEVCKFHCKQSSSFMIVRCPSFSKIK